MYADPKIEIWYAPVGRPTPRPKICILGITPGWTQMRIAYQNAADGLTRGLTPSKAASMKKKNIQRQEESIQDAYKEVGEVAWLIELPTPEFYTSHNIKRELMLRQRTYPGKAVAFERKDVATRQLIGQTTTDVSFCTNCAEV